MIWGELAISLIVPPGSHTSGIFRIGPELEPKHLISQARTLLSVRFDAQPQRAPKPKIAKFGMFPARSEVTAQQEPHKIPPQFGVRSTSTWYPTRDTTFQNFSLMLLRETTTLIRQVINGEKLCNGFNQWNYIENGPHARFQQR